MIAFIISIGATPPAQVIATLIDHEEVAFHQVGWVDFLKGIIVFPVNREAFCFLTGLRAPAI